MGKYSVAEDLTRGRDAMTGVSKVYHSYVVFDPTRWHMASNPVSLELRKQRSGLVGTVKITFGLAGHREPRHDRGVASTSRSGFT